MISKDELKKMDVTSLNNEILSLKKELFALKLGQITGQVKDTSQFPKLRRQIALMLTLIKQKSEGPTPGAKR